MSTMEVLKLFGGLAIFMMGMKMMGDALEKRAGNKLKDILARLTSSPFKGFLVGTLVTAIIQSSSATTVMVVGFVNSGLMTLSQSVGIIIGANVGTAITSWILSLTGISSSNPLILFLKPSAFSQVFALLGIIYVMFSKKQTRKDTGMILLGFAILMTGMEQMSDAVKPLSNIPEFTSILTMFSNPILGVLAGTVLTAVIQSSSASVGILQALSMTGSVTYATAIPVILGQNIGTCITAMLSSMGASREARRAACIHLYFNVIGVVLWLSIYCIAEAIFHFPIVQTAAGPLGIAVVHTVFKILSTITLMPFSKQLEKLARLTIKDAKNTNEEDELLDERLFEMPPVAIQRAGDVARTMATTSYKSLLRSLDLLKDYDAKQAELIIEEEDRVDKFEDRLGDYLVKLTTKELSSADHREVSKLLHIIGDLERISDHAVNVLESAQELHDKGMKFSDAGSRDVDVMIDAVKEVLRLAIDSFMKNDLNAAEMVEPLEQVVDDLQKDIKGRHIMRLSRGECTIELGFILSDLLGNLERISDHCSNIAACEIEVARERFDMHEYTQHVQERQGFRFDATYHEFSRKFALDPNWENK